MISTPHPAPQTVVHGLPINGTYKNRPAIEALTGGSFLASYWYARPGNNKLGDQVDQAICLVGSDQTLYLDNGAFTAFKKGVTIADDPDYLDGFYSWAAAICERCPEAVVIIPDVIDGSVDQNVELIRWSIGSEVPTDKLVPVWHLHEPLELLQSYCEDFNHVAIGSSGEFWKVDSPEWRTRVGEMFDFLDSLQSDPEYAACYVRPRLHMLRGIGVMDSWRFDSADSVNVAVNHNRQARGGEDLDSFRDRVETKATSGDGHADPQIGSARYVAEVTAETSQICGDIFSGFGGFTEGAEAAGIGTKFGANHWDPAVATLAKNHPAAQVIQQDLSEADWSQFPQVPLLIAGPSCQGFTHARGKDRKHHDRLRNTMWAVINAAESLSPEILITENVPEVQNWVLFPAWLQSLELLGYSTEQHVLDAADYGVPQHRLRWFCVSSKSDKPLNLASRLQSAQTPHRSVRDSIDWDYPTWSRIDKPGRSPKVLKQISRARHELGGDRFLLPYYGSGSGLTGRSLDRPCGTIVAQDIWAVVDGQRMRMMQPHEAQRIMGFRDSFQPVGTRREQMRGFGNAVCPPVAEALVSSILAA